MNTYGWMLLGQTLLALIALGVCGGWVLWPFRRDERPYLWLAAPLAGLLSLGGVLAALYMVAGWPFARCLWVGFALNALATTVCVCRGKLTLPSRGQITTGIVVALAAITWADIVCNRSAIKRREPTLAHVHNNDMFNYAIIGNWIRTHRTTDPTCPDQQLDFLPRWHLLVEGSRPVAEVLIAGAAETRGTSALFSFDWFTGVVLSAAVIGFGGLFSSNPILLALLVAGAGISSWTTECRSAFMGKSIAYPGVMLLAAMVLDVMARGGWRRTAIVIALGAALGFALNPVFPPPVLGLVLGGYAALTVAGYLVEHWRSAHPVWLWSNAIRPAMAAILLWAAVTLPAFGVHRYFYIFHSPPEPPRKWSVVIPVSLDLDVPTISTVPAGTRNWTLWCAGGLTAIAMVLAARRGNRYALALLGTVLVIPAAVLAGEYRLHAFQGVLYPLSLAGVALLVGPGTSTRRVAAVAILAACMVGLRVPQHRAAGMWYFYPKTLKPVVLRQSEAEAIRAIVGDDTVDIALTQYPDNHFAMSELIPHGTRVQLQGLAWQRTLGAYGSHYAPHDLMAPKARYSLIDNWQWAPPHSERWVGSRWKLIEDAQTVTMLSIDRPADVIPAKIPHWGTWLDSTPTTLLLHNGTRSLAEMQLRALFVLQHDSKDRTPTLHYRHDADSGSLAVTGTEMTAVFPLHLKPGLNRVQLWVAEADGKLSSVGKSVPRTGFCEWRIEAMDTPISRDR